MGTLGEGGLGTFWLLVRAEAVSAPPDSSCEEDCSVVPRPSRWAIWPSWLLSARACPPSCRASARQLAPAGRSASPCRAPPLPNRLAEPEDEPEVPDRLGAAPPALPGDPCPDEADGPVRLGVASARHPSENGAAVPDGADLDRLLRSGCEVPPPTLAPSEGREGRANRLLCAGEDTPPPRGRSVPTPPAAPPAWNRR